MSLLAIPSGTSSNAGGFYPYAIDGSLRFNDDDSAYLSWTPASAGDQKTFTYSCWVKRNNFVYSQMLAQYTDNSNRAYIAFQANDTIRVFSRNGGSDEFEADTSAVFRDPSAWYHIVVAVDMPEATNSNAVKLWVNGVQQTLTFNSFNTNTDTRFSSANIHYIGTDSSAYSDFYLAEVHFTDGTAYDADAFGEFKNGVWVAKNPSVTYGTNGFHLEFAGNVNDSAGSNNWTANNIAASDYVPDSPTNNFAVLNPVEEQVTDSTTFSDGNLFLTAKTGNVGSAATSTVGFFSGKYYFECYVDTQQTDRMLMGVINDNWVSVNNIGVTANGWGVIMQSNVSNGQLYHNNSTAAGDLGSFSNGDIAMCAVDADNDKIWFGRNGTWHNSGDPAAGTNAQYTNLASPPYRFAVNCTNTAGAKLIANFGQDSTFAGNETAGSNSDDNGIGEFQYTVPSGFLALCTSNLPNPAIDPAQGSSPADYFNTVPYSGNSSNPASVTGVGFQPDFVWAKTRSFGNTNHRLQDAVRGSNKRVMSDLTSAEIDTAGGIQSFDSDGFTVGDGTSKDGFIHFAARTFVAWNWKANGSGVSNTAGDFAVTVSANTESGFSIVDLTDPNTGASYEVGHGLGSPPEMFFIKKTNTTSDWSVYHKDVGNDRRLVLNDTAAQSGSSSVYFGSTTPTSSVVTIGSGLSTGDDWIMYCFHSVEGFSRMDSYTGNGNADGPFVYTGFRPAFLMIKRTDGGTNNWVIYDKERDPYNYVDERLYPNLSNAESGGGPSYSYDFTSNGFKLRSIGSEHNLDGGSYIYMAFAETPFKYSVGR